MDEEELRLYLQTQLETLGWGVFYRPPGNVFLQRPCIIYEPLKAQVSHANNTPYVVGSQFKVTALSDLPGVSSRAIFSLQGIVVEDHRAFTYQDVVNDVYTISVNAV